MLIYHLQAPAARRRLLCVVLATLCWSASPLGSVADAARLPDFEEEVSLGQNSAQLRKLGASPCAEAPLCLRTLWGGKEWKATLRMRSDALVMVELQPAGAAATVGSAVREQLEEFALTPVRVSAGELQCDAFALTKEGQSPDKAMDRVDQCIAKLKQGKTTDYSVWYLDEEEAPALLAQGTLEKAGTAHAKVTAARLSVAGNAVEVGYGELGSLLQPGIKP